MTGSLTVWWRGMRRDVFDRDMWRDIADVSARMFIGAFGIIWFWISSLNIELGMRELVFSLREWIYFAQSIAGLLLVALSCSPRLLLNYKLIMWIFVSVTTFVEIALAMLVYRTLSKLYLVHRFGMGILIEPASARMTKLAFAAVIAAALGVVLALCVRRLMLTPRQLDNGITPGKAGVRG